MKKFIIAIAVVVAFSITFTDLSFAVCVQGPPNTYTCNTNDPNPDLNGVQQTNTNADITVNVLPGAGIDTQDPVEDDISAIETDDGNDNITITGGDLRSAGEGIETGPGGGGTPLWLRTVLLYLL